MFAEPPEPFSTPAPLMSASPWTRRDLFLGAGLLAVAFGAAVVVVIALAQQGIAAGIVATIGFEAALAAIVLGLARRRGITRARLGFVRPASWRPMLTAWVGAYAATLAYGLALAVLDELGVDVSRFSGGNQLPIDAETSVQALAWFGVIAVIVAPLSEELFFRAFLYRGLRRYWGLATSAVVSGLAFSLFHVNLAVIVPFAVIGALFAWAFEVSGSLWTPILSHTLLNGLSFLISVVTWLTARAE